jgi:hypothetical protein
MGLRKNWLCTNVYANIILLDHLSYPDNNYMGPSVNDRSGYLRYLSIYNFVKPDNTFVKKIL